MESIGFKEWSVVCEALGHGRQSIILRKGGVAEGREGFSFKHSKFFLFPTWFHEQPQKVREWDGLVSRSGNAERPTSNNEGRSQKELLTGEHAGLVQIKYAAAVEFLTRITSWPV